MTNRQTGDSPSSAPAGSGDYIVRQGECIESIAFEHGHFWTTIWDYAANAELARLRQNPNVLLPGDRLTIPDIRLREQDCPTDQRHRFLRKGVYSKLRLHLLEEGRPRDGLEYSVEIEGHVTLGRTGPQGEIELRIPPNARRGKLRLIADGTTEEYSLLLGQMDPAGTVSGAQSRLLDLGFDVGPVDGRLGPRTQGAIRTFQNQHDLPETGTLNDATVAKLKEIFGG